MILTLHHVSPIFSAHSQIRSILALLESTLSVPSEAVQRSCADVLPPLAAALGEEERKELLARLLKQLLEGLRYGDRRGAAFGLAGAVKGLGIGALKAHGIVDALKATLDDSKASPVAREGALMAFECLCTRLGRLFEPYVVNLMPQLVNAFGDNAAEAREGSLAEPLLACRTPSRVLGAGNSVVLRCVVFSLRRRAAA